ncbi:MAG: rhodanese-like domain-containing protein, partial [Gammaproteobacteria bacterium]|nr:rhodanese-like domain-containing protein [Gammaproteobacteria bacterium]
GFLLLLCAMNLSASEPVETPNSIPGSTKITAEELIKLLQNKTGIVLVDSRMEDNSVGYIETSVNLPNVDTNCDSLSGILATKSTPVIFYCNGPFCGRSAKAVKIALSCGYSMIYWYREGFKDWKDKGYPFVTK